MSKTIQVKVSAGAKTEHIEEIAPGSFKVRVRVPPEKGKANARVAELLARHFGVSVTDVILVRGNTSREKIFFLEE